MKMRSIFLILIVIVIASGSLAISMRLADRLASSKPIPVESLLSELSGAEVVVEFIWPEGDMHRFLIAHPKSVAANFTTNRYNGSLEIETPSGTVYSQRFSKQTFSDCNWLDRQGLKGWIIHMDSWKSLETIPANTKCICRIAFDEPVSPVHTLWISRIASNPDTAPQTVLNKTQTTASPSPAT